MFGEVVYSLKLDIEAEVLKEYGGAGDIESDHVLYVHSHSIRTICT